MKKTILLMAIMILAVSCGEKKDVNKITYEEIKVEAPFNMPVIKIPKFPNRIFNITKYGAVEGGKVKNTEAIAKAIEACSNAGGGIVNIPKGKWLTGSIHLKSNVNLHLEKGAILNFTDNPQDYLPAVQSSWEGMECYNYSPLIYAFECNNIAISGDGKIHAKIDTWREWMERPKEHLEASKRLYNMAAKNIPVEERDMTKGGGNFRPQFIQFNRCNNILIEDISIRNSPFWTMHLLLCKDAVVRNVDVYAHGHNNDGIDPEMTQNLLVENCTFNQGDDAIVIKSGRNQDAWRLNTPSKNIVVRNCEIQDGHQLLAIGSELSGGVSNVYIHDCVFPFRKDKASLINILFIKTNLRRGGYVNNIYVENIKAGKVLGGVFGISTDALYQWRDLVPTYERRLTKISEIHIKNIELDEAKIAININAESEMPPENITLENITVKKILNKAKHIVNAKDIVEKNVKYGIE